jgi:hypothetical protein
VSFELLSRKFDRLIAGPYLSLAAAAEAECTYRTGTLNAQYAHLRVACVPASSLTVEWKLRFGEQPDEEKERALLRAFAGMLDVFDSGEGAVLGMRMTVTQIDTHPIRSTEWAFRMAGRDVARKILLQTGQLEAGGGSDDPIPVALGAAGLIVQ